MNALMRIANGFLFGLGMILAVALMKALLHMGLC